MPSASSNPKASWPWSAYIDFQNRCAEAFYGAPRHLQQSILPWTFAAMVVNEDNSTNPAMERAIVKHESYGKQLGRLSDALTSLIRETGVKHDDAIEEFLELKAHIDAIKRKSAYSRFEVVLADLKRLRTDNPIHFRECLKRVAELDRD
ncbi:hypothetical protein [Burkholderia sp. Ac-20365]|uniref:hypothetical protein n=1 Tax=Burkholderia sp. Ac-20365 TaxID=2703897 RepID=UPI00197C1A25|nr:hypothetical protein [Burkholderia sp. Ac-20365]MBN3762010.1 hypothetical protein [Burkholderia sp. Ac-20365]